MPKLKLYNTEGKVVGEKKLDDKVFGVKPVAEVVHEVVTGLLASARQPWAHTKTRGEVRGGGKKPWKQKGTGRARQGSTRSPIWVGGGITFGPRSERDYGKKVNRKMKRLAMVMSLSDKASGEQLVLVESLPVKDGKTREVAALVGKLPVKGKITLVQSGRDALLQRASRNLKNVNLVGVGSLGLLDILRADYLLMTPDAAAKLESKYGKSS